MRLRALVLAGAVLLAFGERPAHAQADEEAPKAEPKLPPDEPFKTKSGYAQFFVTTMFGDGFRFNNPYRLATPLGSDAESVSRSAAYVDLGIAVALFGDPLGFQHAIAFRTTIAAEGVGQVVLTPSYMLWRRKGAFALYGRAGIPIPVTPSLTWGLEAGLGGAWFFAGGFGVVAEAVGDIFYGEGTSDVKTATYPMLSGQLGLIGTYEVLP